LEIVLPSIDDWITVVQAFEPGLAVRCETRHGVCFDMPGMTVRMLSTTNSAIPPSYCYPELVTDFRLRLSGAADQPSLIHDRLYAWDPAGAKHKPFDQLDHIHERLREDPQSRAAVFSTWRPELDIESDYPPGQVAGAFRQVGKELQLSLVARSVDVWVGLVPALMAFSQLLCSTADHLGMAPGALIYHCWSAHLYEIDYLRPGVRSGASKPRRD
jgi:hypothetical protein